MDDDRAISILADAANACLKPDKQSQVVRLVNATDSPVVFTITRDHLNLAQQSSITVSPEKGTIRPRSFVYIKIAKTAVLSGGSRDPINQLSLVYKRHGLSRDEPSIVRRTIKLSLASNGSKPQKVTTLMSSIIRALRATVLLALITYNTILIKHEYFS